MLASLFSMIELFGSGKKKMKLDSPLAFDQCFILSVTLCTDFVFGNVPADQVISVDAGTW